MARVKVDIFEREVRRVIDGPDGRRLVHHAGEGMAARARAGAPIETGALRADIQSRPYSTPGLGYDEAVSFPDPAVYYGIFHEGGTKFVRARRFLARAFRTYRLL